MKKSFINRVIRECIVDTRRYRYAYMERPNGYAIIRCKREYLGTTEALNGDNWVTVKEDVE